MVVEEMSSSMGGPDTGQRSNYYKKSNKGDENINGLNWIAWVWQASVFLYEV